MPGVVLGGADGASRVRDSEPGGLAGAVGFGGRSGPSRRARDACTVLPKTCRVDRCGRRALSSCAGVYAVEHARESAGRQPVGSGPRASDPDDRPHRHRVRRRERIGSSTVAHLEGYSEDDRGPSGGRRGGRRIRVSSPRIPKRGTGRVRSGTERHAVPGAQRVLRGLGGDRADRVAGIRVDPRFTTPERVPGDRRQEIGGWRLEAGGWKTEIRKPRAEDRKSKIENRKWRDLAPGRGGGAGGDGGYGCARVLQFEFSESGVGRPFLDGGRVGGGRGIAGAEGPVCLAGGAEGVAMGDGLRVGARDHRVRGEGECPCGAGRLSLRA